MYYWLYYSHCRLFSFLVQLFFDYLPNLVIRHRSEIVIVHTYIILRRIEILQSACIYTCIVLPCVYMSKELPYISFVRTAETEERIMIQVDTVLVYHDVALHHNLLKMVYESLAEVLQVVVAYNQVYLSIQSVKQFCPFGSTTMAEVTEVKNGIVRADYAIPVGNQRFIHFLHIPERTVAETDYISVTEVSV